MFAMHVCVPGAKYSFSGSKKFLFLVIWSMVYIFEESPKSIQNVNGDVYFPGEYCLNREKCESLGSYVTTARSSYGCGKCGPWLLVHKVPFVLQEHVKTTQTDKTRFFFAKEDEFVTQQTIVHWDPFSEQLPINHSHPHTKGESESKYEINVSISHWLMIWATFSFFKSFYSLSIYNQPLIFLQLAVNLQKIMIFSVSNEGIQCTLVLVPTLLLLQ